MKLDRRGFIKLAVGAVAGFHLTPLPYKLIDDSAIWTQNWPWVPKLTRFPEVEYKRGVCTLCPGGCGIQVRLVNNKQSVKVEGLPSAPVNQGKVCPIGAAGPQYEYSLARFETPLKRAGARGSGAYTKMTWSAAFKEVGSKLAELRSQGLAHTVVLISGRNSDLVQRLSARFMQAYGSPNFIEMPSMKESRIVAEKAMFGWDCNLGFDLENAEYILSFGAALIEGWGAPVRSIKAYSDWRANGAKLVQIDNQATLTASKADDWIATVPGTEAALAMGVASYMIANDLYNKDFVNQFTFGFDEFKALALRDYTPEKVANITGASAEDIKRVAKEFGAAEKAVAIGGKGKGNIPTPVYDVMAFMALNALKGNINQPGGVIVPKDLPLSEWPALELDDAAQKSLKAPRLDLAGSDKYPLSTSLLNQFIESVNTDRFYPVNMVILDQANPDFFGSDPSAFRAALAKVPMVVSLSNLADDTSVQADIVLPQTSNFDGPAEVLNPPTLPYPLIGMAQPVLDESPYDNMPAGDLYIKLAKAAGGAVKKGLPFKTHGEMVTQSAIGLFESGRGLVPSPDDEIPEQIFPNDEEPSSFKDAKAFIKALIKGFFWYDPSFEYGDLTGVFKTPSAKFEFVSQTLQNALFDFISEKGEQTALAELGFTSSGDQLFLPHYEPYVPVETGKQFPLLMVPTEQFKLVTSAIGNAPYLTKLLEDTTLIVNDLVVSVNPHTAEALHLADQDRALLKTRKGSLAVRVHLFEGARPDVIYAPIGLGHSGFGYYLKGKGSNPMDIVESVTDPVTGLAMWWGTPAALIKA